MPDDGLTLRELLMEVRGDVKVIKEKLPSYVTWRQMWVALGATASLVVALIRIG